MSGNRLFTFVVVEEPLPSGGVATWSELLSADKDVEPEPDPEELVALQIDSESVRLTAHWHVPEDWEAPDGSGCEAISALKAVHALDLDPDNPQFRYLLGAIFEAGRQLGMNLVRSGEED